MTTAEAFLAGLPEVARPEPAAVSEVSGLKLLPGEDQARFKHLHADCPREQWRDIVAAYRSTPSTLSDDEKLELVIEWSRTGGDFFTSDEEVEKVWQTMPPKAGGLAAGTFIKLSNAAGYVGPTAGKNDVSSAETFGEVVAALAVDDLPEPDEPAAPSRVILRDEAAQNARKPTTWLVDNLLPDGGTVAIRAPFNSFKSFIATDLALSVASGRSAFNALTTRRSGPVVYAMGEGVAGFETQRRPAWRTARGIDPSRRLPIYTTEGVPQVRSSDDVAAYLAAISALPERPALVIIDTTARAMAGLNENEAGDAGLYLAAVELIARRLGCCVLSIMHEGKDSQRGARGSSAFEAGFENVWRMEADTDLLTAKLVPVKLKDDAGIEGIFLQGRAVAVEGAKGSLVFDRLARDDYQRVAGKRAGITNSEVGAALRSLRAVDGETVTTHVLAIEIAGPGADHKLIGAKERNLRDGSHRQFAAYVAHLGTGRGDSTLWSYAPEKEAGGNA